MKSLKPLSRSQNAFIGALVSLLREKDFESIRVSEIIRRSGYSRGSFYSHYYDKYNLIEKIFDREMLIYMDFSYEYSKAIEMLEDKESQIAVITGHMRHIYENLDLYDVMLENRLPVPPIKEVTQLIKAQLFDGISASVETENEDFDQDMYDYIQLSNSFLFIEYWRLNDYSFTPEEMAGKIHAIISVQPYVFDAKLPPETKRDIYALSKNDLDMMRRLSSWKKSISS
ncbi:MAG: TetR/AcrR family transcriptional regulator [Actinobacteria bacterium]|nr:TetR/AcrR family transcriptional regulator [Actinomycetota bacterium]